MAKMFRRNLARERTANQLLQDTRIRKGQPDVLVAQIGDEREEPGKFREVIFTKNEKQFHRHRFVAEKIGEKFEERLLGLGSFSKLFPVFRRFLEQRHKFLELIEDEERCAALFFEPDPRVDVGRGEDKPRPWFTVSRETRGQKRRR